MIRLKNKRIGLLLGLIIPLLSIGQVRPDIYSFTSAERTELANLIIDFVDVDILQIHCDYTTHMGISNYDIHDDFNFLPFHRTYIERLEDWLVSQGHPEYVPLPKWTGLVTPPIEFSTAGPNGDGVSPDCGSTTCANSGSSCSSPTNWNSTVFMPQILQLPIQNGDDLCDLQYFPLNFTIIDDETGFDGLSRVIEGGSNSYGSSWHNSGHTTMGGVMGNFRSPAAAIFWLWHAAVDDKWKEWEENCTQSTTLPIDLYMKDNNFVVEYYRDRGQEPTIDDGPMWTSKDIWVRNQADGITNQTHQNPEFGQTNYVYVRVRNRGYQTSLGNEQLHLYWAKANTALTWPNHWNGSMTNGGGFSLGELLATQTIPQTDAQDQTIVVYAWNDVPDPDDYASGQGSDNPHHFCLLSRIESAGDPMFDEINGSVYHNAQYNNNIVWKNMSIVDLTANAPNPNPCVDVFIGNFNKTDRVFDLEFILPKNLKGNAILAEAEVLVTLDEITWNKWDANGRKKQNLTVRKEERREIILDKNDAFIKSLNFKSNEYARLTVCFRFLVKQMSGQKDFEFHVLQRDVLTGKIVGGETYMVEVEGKDGFYADAGKDQEISLGEKVNINAYSTTDDGATYNWYDQNGKLIYTGLGITVSPKITKKYKLEVIAKNGGIVDYDEIQIKVNEYQILDMSPNPASAQVNFKYNVANTSSAYIMLTQINGVANNYILDSSQGSISIDLSAYKKGTYYAVLVCDGEVHDSRTLIIK